MTEDQRADLLYGVAAVARYLGIGRSAAQHRIDSGHIPSFKIGGTVCARRSEVDAWIKGLAEAGRAEP